MKYYCSKCGAELMRGGRFCPSCGAQIIGVAKAGEDISSVKTDDQEAVVFKKEEPLPDTKHRYEYVPGEDDDDDYDDGGHKGAGLFTILLGVLVAASAVFFLLVFFKSKSFFGGSDSGGQVLTAQEEQTQETAPEASLHEEQQGTEQETSAEPPAETQEPAEEENPPAEEEYEEEEEPEEEEEEPEEEEPEEEPREPYDGSLGNGDYVLKESDSRYYTRSELERLDDRSVLLALNEIYARHGRKFVMAEYREYFESKSWYHGTIEPSEFDSMGSSVFNEYENANRQLLIEIAEDRGLR